MRRASFRPPNHPAILPFPHPHVLPIKMEPGALVEYRLRLYGVPVYWQTRVETFEPGHRFTDVQIAGPYGYWHHLHEFRAVASGTIVRDVADYEIPFGFIGTAAHHVFVPPLPRPHLRRSPPTHRRVSCRLKTAWRREGLAKRRGSPHAKQRLTLL
jgi:ligand-binding SRPBCC domain-containing protein